VARREGREEVAVVVVPGAVVAAVALLLVAAAAAKLAEVQHTIAGREALIVEDLVKCMTALSSEGNPPWAEADG
jgi:hypothetical protein